jgi:glycosyltransferase involved in cell wall biosynthesis
VTLRPKLSVVLLTFNGRPLVDETLSSLRRLRGDCELLVVDSGSTDGTLERVRSLSLDAPLRIHAVERDVSWIAKTNVGIELAAAEHVALLHQDDLWLPGRLEAILGWIDEDPEAVLHFHPVDFIDDRSRVVGSWRPPRSCRTARPTPEAFGRALIVQNFLAVVACVFRKDAALACGGWNTALGYACDWDFWLRLTERGHVRYHSETLARYRVHGQSITSTAGARLQGFMDECRETASAAFRRAPEIYRPRDVALAIAAVNLSETAGNLFFRRWRDAWRSALRLVTSRPWRTLEAAWKARFLDRAVSRLRAFFG